MKLPINTPRLILNDFIEDDKSRLVEIVKNPDFAGYSRFRVDHISDDVAEYIEQAVEQQSNVVAERDLFRLAIRLNNENRQLIGCCVLDGWHCIVKDNDQIGYFIAAEEQGKGYAFEAVSYMLKAYFESFPAKTVQAIVHPLNKSSQNLLIKLGLHCQGEKQAYLCGKQETRLVYSGNANDFQKALRLLEV